MCSHGQHRVGPGLSFLGPFCAPPPQVGVALVLNALNANVDSGKCCTDINIILVRTYIINKNSFCKIMNDTKRFCFIILQTGYKHEHYLSLIHIW